MGMYTSKMAFSHVALKALTFSLCEAPVWQAPVSITRRSNLLFCYVQGEGLGI
jgi:hypothetical protein